MIKPKLTKDEPKRLRELYKYNILNTPPEQEYDTIVKLASKCCNTPISLISFIDIDRQWFKAKVGIKPNETPRDIAFCAHTIHDDKILVVNDATQDELFSGNPLVTSYPRIRFYAGAPLSTPGGYKLGTLCVIDTKPRQITEEQIATLQILAQQVVKHLELKHNYRRLEESLAEIKHQNNELNHLISIATHDQTSSKDTLEGLVSLRDKNQLTSDEFQSATNEIKYLLNASSDLLQELLSQRKNSLKE